jgi:hypothetical protein
VSDDGPYLLTRETIGKYGGNRYPFKVPATYEETPGSQTVTLEEWKAGKRP